MLPAGGWLETAFAPILFDVVILGTFFLVLKHLIGFGNFFEAFFGIVLFTQVRVELPC